MASYKKNNYRPNRLKHEEVSELTEEQLHQQSTTAEVFDTLDEGATKVEQWFERYRKIIFGAIGGVLVVAVGYMLYHQFVTVPRNNNASNELSYPLQTFENALNATDTKVKDSLFVLSLEGSNGRYGFLGVAENYSGTKAANIANYSAGMAYLQMGKYKEAVQYLDKFSSSDQILSSLALGNIGDAFAQLKQPKEALEYYQKAYKNSPNNYTAPIYLHKAGVTAVELQQYKKAIEFFELIKRDYPKSDEARTIDIYLSQAKVLNQQK